MLKEGMIENSCNFGVKICCLRFGKSFIIVGEEFLKSWRNIYPCLYYPDNFNDVDIKFARLAGLHL